MDFPTKHDLTLSFYDCFRNTTNITLLSCEIYFYFRDSFKWTTLSPFAAEIHWKKVLEYFAQIEKFSMETKTKIMGVVYDYDILRQAVNFFGKTLTYIRLDVDKFSQNEDRELLFEPKIFSYDALLLAFETNMEIR